MQAKGMYPAWYSKILGNWISRKARRFIRWMCTTPKPCTLSGCFSSIACACGSLPAAVALLFLYINSASVLGFVLGFLSIPYAFFLARSMAVSAYKSNETARGKLVHYTFYEDCFTVQSSYSQSTIWYDDLYRVIVRKHSVCLMVSNRIGYALCENECPESVLDFLRERCAEKRKPKAKETLFSVLFALLCVLFLAMPAWPYWPAAAPLQKLIPRPRRSQQNRPSSRKNRPRHPQPPLPLPRHRRNHL